MSRLPAPTGTCNLPPVPVSGQTVTWTLAGSPYEICQNITIPSTSTVIVEAGVHINFDPDMQVVVLGTMHLQGQVAQHIVLQAPAVFPPIIDIDGGVFDASFSDFTGQVRVENGSNVAISDSQFQGSNGILWAQELPTTRPTENHSLLKRNCPAQINRIRTPRPSSTGTSLPRDQNAANPIARNTSEMA